MAESKSGFKTIDMLWHDLKRAVCGGKRFDLAEKKQFCEEKWDKIPTQWYESLTTKHHTHLIKVPAAKTRY